ncbi:MAG: phage minor head protein [Alloprevotella sp.]|nr:phage minor head protein [Alloprevotella sp.]
MQSVIPEEAYLSFLYRSYEKDGDRYLLQYRTVGDERVRQEHALLNRVTLPLSSSFGDEHFPPNGWNCRCSAVQVRKGKYPETDLNEAYQRAEASSAKDTKGMFRFNVGKEKKAIPDYNPYTISKCKTCPVAKGKSKLAKPQKTNYARPVH